MGLCVGVDMMGSETEPGSIFEAVSEVNRHLSPSDSLLVFSHPSLQQKFSKHDPSIEFLTTDEAIEMEESPLIAVRRKKKSTMALAMHMIREKKLDAFISTGNTGALVATARFHLQPLPTIARPALLVMIPPGVAVLDVGANVNPKPEHLIAYATLGALYRKSAHGIENPSIGLLNIGVEEQKGTRQLKQTYALLQEKFGDRFLGNVEGRDVFEGTVDVLVTDGFSGNVFLKTSEGISQFIIDFIQSRFDTPEIINRLNDQFNYAAYPGAFLAGVDGLVIKCHGNSNTSALMSAMQGAFAFLHNGTLEKIKSLL